MNRRNKISICWFQNNLRLSDNSALQAAGESDHLLPLYIQDSQDADAASKCWLYKSLLSLQGNLREKGSDLLLFKGSPLEVFSELHKNFTISSIHYAPTYLPGEEIMLKQIKAWAIRESIELHLHQDAYLNEPEYISKPDGSPYLVFTAYWNAFLKKHAPVDLLKTPSLPPLSRSAQKLGCDVDELKLLPNSKWASKILDHWKIGEEAAKSKWKNFFNHELQRYNVSRDIPSESGTSLMSPHLHFGEISPRQILSSIENKFGPIQHINDPNLVQFCKEVVWREFACHLLFHFPKTTSQPLKVKFKSFPWSKSEKNFKLWQKGQTGIPLVDAGMRELWATGYMHNRVRMIAASFLVKNLGLHWIKGANHFYDCLVDADLANNTLGWQWVAGCGADAAPYFRIFNPVLQGEKFDSDGAYVKKWCPELRKLTKKWVHKPWLAPADVLQKAAIEIGKNYPNPVVDLGESRRAALARYQELS